MASSAWGVWEVIWRSKRWQSAIKSWLVIRGWLVELMEQGLREYKLKGLSGYVEDTREVTWTIEYALEKQAWIPVIAQSETALYRYRDPDSTAGKAVALLRHAFGGHPLHGSQILQLIDKETKTMAAVKESVAAYRASHRLPSDYALLIGRVLVSQIFIISGIGKIMDPDGTAGQMEGRGMFWIHFFLWTAVAVEIVAGISVLLGYKIRLGALALFLFLIPVTLTFHNFWTYADPKERQINMIMFMHNLTLMGGLLLLMAFGPGRFSIDHWWSRSS